jgi:hypothetical protein
MQQLSGSSPWSKGTTPSNQVQHRTDTAGAVLMNTSHMRVLPCFDYYILNITATKMLGDSAYISAL